MSNSSFEIKTKKTVKKLAVMGLSILTLALFVTGIFSFQKVFGANEREVLQLKLSQLKNQISNYQQQITQTKNQAASLTNEISIYDNQIRSLELEIEANQTQTEDTTLQINELEIQIQRRQNEIEQNKKILSQLILQLSKLDNNSFLQIGLGTDDFSTFLDQIQYVRSVQNQVYSLVTRIKEIKQKLETQKEDLKQSLTKLQALKEQLNVSQDSLESQRGAKEQLLSETKGVEKNYQKLLGQTKNEEDKILSELDELNRAGQARGGKKILVGKGALAWPIDGILTQGYGNTGFTSLGYSFHSGLDIAAPAGKPIYAPADGVVANCDTGAVAYGTWCTVKHNLTTKSGGNQCIVSLFAHMRSAKVKAGQKVQKGDLIGYEGNSGNTTRLLYGPERGYHLHFTIFDCDGYKVTPGANTAIYGSYSVPSGYTYNPASFLGN